MTEKQREAFDALPEWRFDDTDDTFGDQVKRSRMKAVWQAAYSAGLAAREPEWECPKCGFCMNAKHYEAGRADACPACSELELRARERVLRKALEKAAHRLERIDGFGCPQDILDDMRAALKETGRD